MADEHSLNSNLAEILRQAKIDAAPQVTVKDDKGKRRTPDIVCKDVQGYDIVIEAKRGWGSSKLNANKTNSIRQADELVDKHFCHAAIALIYPDGYENQDHLQTGKVKVAVRTPIDIRKKKSPQWKNRLIKDLPRFIKGIPSQLVGQPEELAKRAETSVNQADKKFSKDDVAAVMDNLRQGNHEELAKITNFKGLLVDLLTCFMFHTKLDDIRHRYPKHFDKSNRPATLQECIDSNDPIARFQDAYEKWLKIDYTNILEWNIAILKAFRDYARFTDAVKILARNARSIQRAKGSLNHDVVGITFCNAITSAKQEGAMYTTLPAATMLTHLLFHKAKINWKNLEEVTRLRIVDFACGSGTLLIACANYILNYKLAEAKKKDREEVANALFEQMLYGYDCNQRAIFQTTTGLAMIAPSIAFKKTRLHAMPLGENPEEKGEVLLGSLEWLLGKDDLFFHPPLGQGIDRQTEPIKMPICHFAIMNPPFTRMAIRHKQFKTDNEKEEKEEQLKIEKKEKAKKEDEADVEKKLREREEYFRKINPAMSAAGNSTAFLALVDKYIDPKIGKAGLVLPAMIASGETGQGFRIWLAKHFHIPYIIVSYDPKRIFFSGNTNIGEMLLVLERKKKTPKPTQVIKLTDNPVHETDAFSCAQAILSGEQERIEEFGEVDEIQPAEMERGDWNATQFLSNDLYRIALEIPTYWTSSFKKQINILHRTQIIIGAQRCHPGKLHATPALWYHDTDYCDKMEVQPDCHVQPKKTNPEVLKFLENPSRLKIAWRIRFTTIKNFACRTTVPSVSASWATIEVAKKITKVDEETVEKAVCLILNSTPAKVGTILARTNKTISYVHLGNVKLNRIPMPLLYAMKPSAFRALAKVYDEWKSVERKRLPETNDCPVQIAIDNAVCKHTGFPEKLCRQARHLLVHEPMVTGKRYQPQQEETQQAKMEL